uniref:Ig-like domain-containing protein n=1 Tax=Laticauda laticaudata TaxID=8630 RepID=A0A8C5RJU9_LATLA
MPRSFVLFLVALGSWAFEKGFTEENFVRIQPENPVVQFGGSLEINCSANIEANAIGLETAFRREIIGTGSNWKVFRLTNISDWNTLSLCFAADHKAKPAKATITVYKSPEGIELDPVPEMEVGKQYNLICRVSGVAPIRDLTVTLLKGEEQLLVKTFKDHTHPEAGAVVVNHHMIAQQNDYNKTITCQTSLDLRPTGPLLKNTSHSISLWTFDFAKAPLLHTGLFLEAGTLMKVTCDAPEASPADEAVFDLRFAGKSLTFNATVMGGLASAQAVIASSSVGDHELICMVSLGPVTKNVKKTVNVFALPKPILQIGSSEAGQKVNITCGAEGSASPGFKMQITDTAKILASGNVNFLQHEMIARQEDDEREFICQVTLTIDGQVKERSVSQILTVFYGPQMDDSSCPRTWTWKEGSTTTLTCSALGNPTPTVQCWKDGRLYNIGEPQLIQIDHDGIYQCNATNQYGCDVRDVTVHVECKFTL